MSISFQLGIATEKWKGARDTQRHDLASSPDQKILLIDMDRGLLLGQKANLISCCSLVTIHRQYFRISYILGISSLHPICCAAKQKETAPPLTRITFRTSSLDMANSVYKRKYDRSATVCVCEKSGRERRTEGELNWAEERACAVSGAQIHVEGCFSKFQSAKFSDEWGWWTWYIRDVHKKTASAHCIYKWLDPRMFEKESNSSEFGIKICKNSLSITKIVPSITNQSK